MSAEPLHVEASTLKPEELEELTAAMVKELKTVFDPEIPVDIYELGLIYKIDIADKNGQTPASLTKPPARGYDGGKKYEEARALLARLAGQQPADK